MKRRLLAGLIPLAFVLAGPVQADIYAFVDSNGVRHLSNVPSDPRYKLVMRTPAYSNKAAQPSSYAPNNLYTPNVFGSNLARKASRAKPIRVNEQNRKRFAADINRIAAQYRLEPALMHAVISAESSYNPWAVSPKGAMGLMQLMPGTAERFGVSNAYDPVANMHGGARYLRWLLDRFNNIHLAVAAYNAGEG
ncbi:MAG: lytic transglycosylase domain-containing protein, partial [Candidatus Competibacteraceae bacterium]|nr:lytic transglycosylase domain-containing protein [Candidatus Competibacteraceae bacterium]